MATTSLRQNEFFNGGFMLMVLGGAASLAWRLPPLLQNWATRTLTVQLEVRKPEAVRWLNLWVNTHPYMKRCRNVALDVNWGRGGAGEPLVVPGYGYHLVRQGLRWFLIERRIDEGDGSNNDIASLMKQEVLRISTLGRDVGPISELVQMAHDAASRGNRRDEMSVYYNLYGTEWAQVASIKKRTVETVIMPDGLIEGLLDDMGRFISSDAPGWYGTRGIPYRRGYMLTGPPGGGKTSLVKALASHFGLTLYILDLKAQRLGDAGLIGLMSSVPTGSLVLIEDIDCHELATNRERDEDDAKLTLSGLLNATDGILAGEGRILMFTANKPENLDYALVRPGRIDCRFEIGHASPSQAERMFLRFFPEAAEQAVSFAANLPPETSMAEVQAVLSGYMDLDQAASHFDRAA